MASTCDPTNSQLQRLSVFLQLRYNRDFEITEIDKTSTDNHQYFAAHCLPGGGRVLASGRSEYWVGQRMSLLSMTLAS